MEFFYCRALKQNVKVKADVICTCVDHPEQTKIFQVGDHNGTYSLQWGKVHNIDHTLKENHLPNCKQYKINLVSSLSSDAEDNRKQDAADTTLIPDYGTCKENIC